MSIRRISLFCLVLGLAVAVHPTVLAAADEGDVVAVFKIKGAMSEAPSDPLGLGSLFGDATPPNMFDTLEKLRQARTDNNLRAVVFDIQESALGLAQIEELRAQFKALRAADKDVLIFCEYLDNRMLLLGSEASRLVLLPKGIVVFNGFYSEGLYFKNLLDNIHVEADILHCGAYKSAGEPFYRDGPSPEAEEMVNWLLDSIFEETVKNVAGSRNLKPETVRELIDKGLFSPQEALDAGLVDKLQYREDFIESVKDRYGPDVDIVSDYGKKKGPDIDFENPFAIFRIFSDMMKSKEKPSKSAIAVVYVEGPITTGRSEPSMFGGSSNAGSATIRKAIAQAAADHTVKALILRVDSPGGSAIASEVICEATKRFKASGRPCVVSMGNVAGSGGYYVATLGDTIFAEPSTLTGSIGVVGGKIITKGLWDWIGVTGHEYKRGEHSDLWNTNRRYAEPERDLMMDMLTRIYGEFKDRVKEGRGDRLKGDLEDMAGGRVYTGAQALDLGLVDRLGGFADAIKYTAEEANLGSAYELRIYPKPKTLIDVLTEAFGGEKKDDEFVAAPLAASHIGSSFQRLPAIAGALEALRMLEPQKAKAFGSFLTHLELLSSEGVLLSDVTLATLCP